MEEVMDKAREIALIVLKEVNVDGKYANISLKQHLDKARMDSRDARLATQLVYGTLENQPGIDIIIRKFAKLKRANPWVENILRMGCYQILYLDKIPDSAACNESVELCKKYAPGFFTGFVNGVLRNIARNKDKLHVNKSQLFPSWIIEKWRKEYGDDMVRQMTSGSDTDGKITIRINRFLTNSTELVKQLNDMGIDTESGLYFDEALRIKVSGNIGDNPLYKKGLFIVQGESSMLVSHIVNPQKGETILDACSAPGGKAIHIAELMKGQGKIFAWDIHSHRVELIRRNCSRMGITIIDAQKQDAQLYRPDLDGYFDRILVDAPCSGLGVAHHKPDIKLNLTPEKLEDLAALQWNIISTCSLYVKPGGVLVYSTCTINWDENERIIQKFLENHDDFALYDFTNEIPDSLRQGVIKPGMIRLTPGRDKLDGFFIARMRRKK